MFITAVQPSVARREATATLQSLEMPTLVQEMSILLLLVQETLGAQEMDGERTNINLKETYNYLGQQHQLAGQAVAEQVFHGRFAHLDIIAR